MIHHKYVGLLLLLPFFVLLTVFHLYPIILTFIISFTRYDGLSDPTGVGLQNYIKLLGDTFFWRAFVNTWRIWLPNIIIQLSLAFFLAFVFTDVRRSLPGVPVFRAVYYFPNLVTAASIALLVTVLLNWKNGAINQFLFGENEAEYVNWLVNPERAQFTVSIIQTWMWFGHSTILLSAGMMGIPHHYYEAALVDGANKFQLFFRITIPLLMPVISYVFITSLIGGMQIFDIPHVISIGPDTGGGATEKALETMVIYLYNTAFRFERFGYAAAMSYLLFLLIGSFSVLYFWLIRKQYRGNV